MASFESGAKEYNIDTNNQPKTKQGRERQYAEKIESRKEFAELSMAELLDLLSKRLGREVILADLAVEFGKAGADAYRYLQLVRTGQIESELIINQAHLIESVRNLKLQTEVSH